MIKALINILVFFTSISLFSNKIQDKEIAQGILDSNKDITFEVIKEVLEFDPENQIALKEKIKLLYLNDGSLYEIKKLFEEITIDDYSLNKIKLEVLYRLKQYDYIIKNSEQFSENDSPESIFYISDSFLRKGVETVALELVLNGLYENPYNSLLNELNFLLTLDPGSLRIIRENEDGYNSLIRLYSRMDSQSKSFSLIEKILIKRINETEIDKFNSLNLNYPFIKLIEHLISDEITGEYYIDRNDNGFIDTVFKIDEGIIQYKGIDISGDRVFDNEIWLVDGLPEKIKYNDTVLNYGSYPYVKNVVNYDLNNEIIWFVLNKEVYRLKGLADDTIISLNNYRKGYNIKEKEFFTSSLYEKWVYKDLNTIIKYKDEDYRGTFSHIILEREGEIVSGVRDLNFDGEFDIHERYVGGVLIGAAFLDYKKYTYYEGYEPIQMKVITDDNHIQKIIIKGSNNNEIALPIEDEYSLGDIVDIERDSYNWWIEE